MKDIVEYIMNNYVTDELIQKCYEEFEYKDDKNALNLMLDRKIIQEIFTDKNNFDKIFDFAIENKCPLVFTFLRAKVKKKVNEFLDKIKKQVYIVDRINDKLYIVYLPKQYENKFKDFDLNKLKHFVVDNKKIEILEKRIHKEYGVGFVVYINDNSKVIQYENLRALVVRIKKYLELYHGIKGEKAKLLYLFDKYKDL